MDFNEIDGFSSDENPTDFSFSFNYFEERLNVTLSLSNDDPCAILTDDIFFDGSEFEIFSIAGYNSHMSSSDDIVIENNTGQVLGVLCLSCKSEAFNISEMTTPRYLSYISDCSDLTVIGVDNNYTFKKSYLLIKKECSQEYRNEHQETSALWGGFTHNENSSSYRAPSSTKLIAESRIVFPTIEHEEKLNNAVLSTNGFDRFLKKYHLLELIYDYLCVAKLRTIDSSLKDFRDVMSKYSRDDIDNLKSLLTDYVSDISPLLNPLYAAGHYENLVKEIFQNYSKNSNILKNEKDWGVFWNRLTSADLAYRTDKKFKFSNYTNEDDYNKVILRIIAYWIYRIRCSIAHNKIGEFLFDNSQEVFVVEIGESLLDGIIESVFSNPDFVALIESSKKIDQAILTTVP